VARQEKEGDRGLRPCEDQGSRLVCSHVVFQLQKSVGDIWPRISSANAPQKGRSGSSERGPSSERRSAGETVRQARRAKGQSRVGLTAQDGRGPAQDPGWRESVIQRSRHRQKRWRDRGTGVVRTTGSYEGSPSDGRHLRSSRSVSVTRSVHGWSSALRNILRPVYQGQKPRARPGSSPREGEGGARVDIGARQGCQRLDRISAVGRKRPRPR
jgi:hypothetical protein